ncbi:MAG: hypothetical protein AAFQ79_16460 [Pseudomonadota bacterium]
MLDELLLFGGVASVFALIDFIVPPALRDKVAEIILGFHSFDVTNLESSIINALLAPFIKDNRIKPLRVLIFSISFASVLTVLISINSHNSGNTPLELNHYAIVFIFIIGIILFPLDFISLQITRRIFYGSSTSAVMVVFKIVLDVVLSALVVVGSIYFTWQAFSFLSGTTSVVGRNLEAGAVIVLMGTLFSVFSAIFINLLQVLSLMSGCFIRFLVWLSHRNRPLVLYTNFQNAPFTLIGIVSAFIVVII